jgi:hypothetical protein
MWGLSRLNKGQAYSLDMIMAIGIFVIVLIGVGWSWDFVIDKTRDDGETKDMEIVAKNSISMLLETGGIPADWYLKDEDWFDENSDNVYDSDDQFESVGLSVSYPSILHEDKVEKLDIMSDEHYGLLRKVLGLRRYQFHIGFYVYDGSTYPNTPNYQAGNSSVNLAEKVVVITRYGVINNNWTRVNYKVWK